MIIVKKKHLPGSFSCLKPPSLRSRHVEKFVCVIFILFFSFGSAAAQETDNFSKRDIFHPVFAKSGMVTTQEAVATRIGVEILKKGGNAVDAAVAVGFALAVTLPRAGNLGGGGFMLIYNRKEGKTITVDYREKAPLKATRDMFLNTEGNVDIDRARFSYKAAGVPGTVAGLALALKCYGTMSLQEVIEPAIRLADKGIVVTRDLAASLKAKRERLLRWEETKKIFFKPGEVPFEPGDRLVQEDLARSLQLISQNGPQAFYKGSIAEKIAADSAANGGLITLQDLKAYRPVIRQPVRGTYRGHEIISVPPPSSGGIHLIQILNILEAFPIASMGHNSAETIHLMAEAMKLAYADRDKFLGDPDFFKLPLKGLISKKYAAKLRTRINPYRAAKATAISAGNPLLYESEDTTHFSLMDSAGNVVSNTYTLNFSYGSGIVAAGTGILLNNEMDDFSAKPGVPNAYGLTGGEVNAIKSGKRPVSLMTPTIVMKDQKPFLATGSPGGSHIITTVLQIIMNVVDHNMNIAAASVAPRIHHQWLPDELRVEQGLSPDTIALLKARGHKVVFKNAMGSTQSIMLTGKGFLGYSDPRQLGALTSGY
jgi:gamma-glutamyltranspeptidase/glutathione hydrolase